MSVQDLTHVGGERPQSVMESRRPTLRAVGLCKRFGSIEVLHGVDLELFPGEVHALLGENGAGKSTIINMLSGRLSLSAGEIAIDGKAVHFTNPLAAKKAGVSIIAQELELVPTLSIRENIFLGVEPTRFGLIDWRAVSGKVAATLAELGVGASLTQQAGSLSVADQQLVEIAKAVIGEFRVLIMDEPTSALNLEETRRLFGVVRALRSKGVAILYVSHRLWEIFDLADRVTVLRDGNVVQRSAIEDTNSQHVIRSMLGPKSSLVSDRRDSQRRARAAAGPPVLAVTNLTSPPALRNVSLTVAPGEVVGLAGVLGSGRTELCEAIYGLRRVEAGATITLNGRPATLDEPKASLRDGVFLLPEDRKQEGILPHLDLRENMILVESRQEGAPEARTLGNRLRKFGLTFVKDRAEVAAFERSRAALGIKCAGSHSRITELSGGNQQKVLFARGSYRAPAVMILSEPTRGVDVGAKEEIYTAIDRLAAEGTAILVSSSEITELLRLCSRLYVLRHGAIVAEVQTADASEESVLSIMAA